MAEPSKDKQTSRNPRAAVGRHVRNAFFGKFVTLEFFKKYWAPVFLALVLIMTFIATKYQCMTRMEQITALERELNVAQTECIREQSTFRSRCRESAMQQLVDSLLPGLGVQEQPPFVIAAK